METFEPLPPSNPGQSRESKESRFAVCCHLANLDLFSDRTALLVAFASAAASYVVTGFAYSLPMLFLSRIFCVLMHVMQGTVWRELIIFSSQP